MVPVFRDAGPDAKNRLARVSKGYQQREIYRDNLRRLNTADHLEIQPEADESIRKLKVNVRRAANELKVDVSYGETVDGTLLVWLEPQRERTRGPGRPRKSGAAGPGA